jgi:hypothetical protein
VNFHFGHFFLNLKLAFFGVVGGMSSICFVMQCDAQNGHCFRKAISAVGSSECVCVCVCALSK